MQVMKRTICLKTECMAGNACEARERLCVQRFACSRISKALSQVNACEAPEDHAQLFACSQSVQSPNWLLRQNIKNMHKKPCTKYK
jgi:hypothetical protein